MHMNDLIKLASLLDANGEYKAASEIDKLILKTAEEEGIVVSPEALQEMKDSVSLINDDIEQTIDFLKGTGEQLVDPELDSVTDSAVSFSHIFEKLAKIADELDEGGAGKEANMIDGFIKKHAQDFDKDTLEALNQIEDKTIALLTDLHQLFRYLPEGEILTAMSELKDTAAHAVVAIDKHMSKGADVEQESQNLGPAVEQEMGELSEEVRKLESSRHYVLDKTADEAILPGVTERKEEADTEQSKRYDDRHHHSLQVREPKSDQERVDREGRKEHHISTYKPANASLSSRYCPDHIGVQMGRVGESTYQCPIDHKAYNWEVGYTDYDGNQYPGGSVAAQTPDSSGYGISHRIFDSRQNTINEIN